MKSAAHFQKQAWRLVIGTLVVYALLVATHRGEFWPFSIYPMFSQAGQPWSRVVVRTLDADTVRWRSTAVPEALPGEPFALAPRGINPNDLSEYLTQAQRRETDRGTVLRQMFRGHVALPAKESRAGRGDETHPQLLVVRVKGRLADGDSIAIRFVPHVLLRPDTTLLNPHVGEP